MILFKAGAILASEGKSEQDLPWVLNLIFQYINDDGVEKLSNGTSSVQP